MKLEKGTKVKIIKYGHQVVSKDGKTKDLMPQLIGKTGVVHQAANGYMIKMDEDQQILGWFDENQTEEIK